MTRATDEQLVLVRAYADSIRMRDTAAALKAVLAELEELRQAYCLMEAELDMLLYMGGYAGRGRESH